MRPILKWKSLIWTYCGIALWSTLLGLLSTDLQGQTTAFSYQGRLSDNHSPANGNFDLRFVVYDASTNGNPVSGVITSNFLGITNGLFSVSLDFGTGIFDGNSRWLDIGVRTNGAADFVSLNPRELLTSVPTAIFAGSAATAVTLSGTLPPAGLNGTYGSAIQFINSSNSYSGDGAGLFNVPGSLPTEIQSGTAVQTRPNTSYLLTNSHMVNLTLPVDPKVGDIVRIAGTGGGGWTLAQNAGQTVLGYNLQNSLTPWTPLTNSLHTQGLELGCSADGTHILVDNINFWEASYDAGNSWSLLTNAPLGASYHLALSADGQHAVAASSNTRIFTCGTFADNWLGQTNSAITNYSALAISADGSHVIATVNGGGIYSSADFGTNWSLTAAPSNSWVAIHSSVDGSRLAAAGYGSGIYLSADYGLTWRLSSAPSSNSWQVMTASADGSRIFAFEGTNAWISADFGQSWSKVGVPGAAWYAIACSADGSRIAASAGNSIAISTDAGGTWSLSHAPSLGWRGIASSATGNFLANTFLAGVFSFQTSTTAGPAGFLNGSPYSAVELQFIGNGQFLPLSHEGTLVTH